jgi:hypothetical protein
MAIDMIENNELGALAPSRLGLRQFADDGFKNYVGGEEFYNLFGSKTRKESLARVEREARAFWSKYKITNCQDSEKLIKLTLAEIETLNKRLAANNKDPFIPVWIRVTREVEGAARRMYVSLDCEAKLAAESKEAERKAILDTLTQTGDTAVQKAQTELQGLQSTLEKGAGTTLDNKKILTYGAIGIVGLIAIALILRK